MPDAGQLKGFSQLFGNGSTQTTTVEGYHYGTYKLWWDHNRSYTP
jgi:hypothetical protein